MRTRPGGAAAGAGGVLAGLAWVTGWAAGRRRGEEERRALRVQATADPLTGLANRRALAARFRGSAGGAGGRVGLVLADLDGFKAVNDAHGHEVGDELLLAAARRLAAAAGPGELPARLGGDEFALLLPGLPADPAVATFHAAARAAAVSAVLGCPYAVDGLRLRVGASAGAAAAPARLAGLPGLLRAADRAMYRAKRERLGGAAATTPVADATAAPGPIGRPDGLARARIRRCAAVRGGNHVPARRAAAPAGTATGAGTAGDVAAAALRACVDAAVPPGAVAAVSPAGPSAARVRLARRRDAGAVAKALRAAGLRVDPLDLGRAAGDRQPVLRVAAGRGEPRGGEAS